VLSCEGGIAAIHLVVAIRVKKIHVRETLQQHIIHQETVACQMQCRVSCVDRTGLRPQERPDVCSCVKARPGVALGHGSSSVARQDGISDHRVDVISAQFRVPTLRNEEGRALRISPFRRAKTKTVATVC
jgi:hypothetical protein